MKTLFLLPGFGLILTLVVSSQTPTPLHPELIRRDATIAGPTGWNFGANIAVDGNMMAVSAPEFADGGKRGAIYIYRNEGSAIIPNWVQKQRIDGPGRIGSIETRWGDCIAMRDGLLAIGDRNYGAAPLESNRNGVVYLYGLDEATGTYASLSSQVGQNTRFGTSISISGDLIVAGSFDGTQVRVLQRDGNSMSTIQVINRPHTDAFGFGGSFLHDYGRMVAVDGDYMAIGFIGENSAAGAVYHYKWNGTTFTYETKISAPDAGSWFGFSVEIRGDRMVVAAPYETANGNDLHGAVYVYDRQPGGWIHSARLVSSLTTDPLVTGATGLLLSDDGNTVIATTNGGVAATWKRTESGVWHESIPLSPPTLSMQNGFGHALDMSGDRVVISRSSTQQAFTFETDYSNSPFFADVMRSKLFHEDAAANPFFEPGNAAFRYQLHLYEDDNGQVKPTTAALDTYYGAAEESRISEVMAELEARLQMDPFGPGYPELFLDIIYEQTRIKYLQAHEKLIDIDIARLQPPAAPGQPVINNEIVLYETNLTALREAIAVMIGAWDADIAFTASGAPAGFDYFRTHVPDRPLMPASYLDGGVLVPLQDGSGNDITAPLVAGYKDAILLFRMLGDHASSAAELAKLYRLRSNPTAKTDAKQLLQDARNLSFVHGNIVREMFRDETSGDLPDELTEPLANWEEGLARLDATSGLFDNGINPLGYDEGFLLLLQRTDGGNNTIFNSYNVLDLSIDVEPSNSNYLDRAEGDRLQAIQAYSNYRGGLDELSTSLIEVNSDALNRLDRLVGWDYLTQRQQYDAIPGANTDPNGGFKVGSELWDQYQNIRRARIQILKNGQEIANLRQAVRIEIARSGDIQDVVVDYGNQRSAIEQEIGRIEAAQKFTEVLANACNPANWAEVTTSVISAGMRIYGEVRKGELGAERERLAAQEKADIEGIDSTAKVETMLLDMKTLVLSSQENAVILQQEVGRLTGLLRERKTLERRIDSHTNTLANRYFADPIHKLRYLNELLIAERTFTIAQQTAFFMARALEYKWNVPFDAFLQGVGSGTTSMAAIYRARNAQELQLIVDDMRLADGTNIGVTNYESQFSLKEDAFGYAEMENGSPALYPDPISGEMVGATQAFRSLLARDFQFINPGNGDVTLNIPFSSVRDPLNSFFGPDFFRGPRGLVVQPDGSLALHPSFGSAGRYRDKIRELAVTMPGEYGIGPPQTVSELFYGGTSFLRTRKLGRYNELLDETLGSYRFDRLSDELTAIPVRASTFSNGRWETTDTLVSAPSVHLTGDVWPAKAIAPPESAYIDTFRERSVAANGWQIRITLKEGTTYATVDQISDIILHIRHQASLRSE